MQVEYFLPGDTVRPVAFTGQVPGVGRELGTPPREYRWRPALGYASVFHPPLPKH